MLMNTIYLFKNLKYINLNKGFLNTLGTVRYFCTNSKDSKYNPEELDRKTKKVKLFEKFPERIQLYLKLGRYDRPIGYMLLFWPCAWGLTLGAPVIDLEYVKYLGLFFSGSVLMRSAGCIINDMWDKDLDKQVIRCQDRPLVSGKITNKQAFVFLSAHLTLSLGILLQLPLSSIIAGLAIMPIVCIYPFMKRVTNFPQFFLGLAFNSGIIVAFPTIIKAIDFGTVLPFYLGGVIWTLIYDTIYAHMDKQDDKQINIKSTALYLGENTKLILTILAFLMIGLFYYTYSDKFKTNSNKIAFFTLVISLLFQLISLYSVNLNSPLSCLKHFKANTHFGLLIFLYCLFNKINI